ncbi:hypothetical protein ITX31_15640 [Arthrobacter gandavensis]|uniref:hypothetical protein n=1 Tax=Arthrobacter gandavensis TaxID=169960 RepID=UPI00188EE52F|nr:hypothetical protein [Arthrobacter gandavensis]MBF4995528.1 hypothetical protein [Arthrobacter gandavensis]
MAGGSRTATDWNLLPGVLWSAVFLLAALSSGITTAAAWAWGLGTVLLLLVFPWALVRTLDRSGDLRTSIARAPVAPVILGAGALCFMLLRLILWLDGPRVLAAAVFSMLASYAAVLVLNRAVKLDWSAVSTGAAAVVLPFVLAGMTGGPVLAAGAAVLLAVLLALRFRSGWQLPLVSAAAGAVVGGGLFVLLASLDT